MVKDKKIKTVMVVTAHPDDAEIMCGGTIIKFASMGRKVVLVIMTNGEKGSPNPKDDLVKLVRTRKKETCKSAKFMGVSEVVFLDHKDGELEDTHITRAQIVKLVRQWKPEAIFTPDPTNVFLKNYVNHVDHRTVGWIVLNSLIPSGNWHFYREHAGNNTEPHEIRELYLATAKEPDFAVDISKFFPKKIKALAFHKSQLGPETDSLDFFRNMFTKFAKEAGKRHQVKYAEEYRRIVF